MSSILSNNNPLTADKVFLNFYFQGSTNSGNEYINSNGRTLSFIKIFFQNYTTQVTVNFTKPTESVLPQQHCFTCRKPFKKTSTNPDTISISLEALKQMKLEAAIDRKGKEVFMPFLPNDLQRGTTILTTFQKINIRNSVKINKNEIYRLVVKSYEHPSSKQLHLSAILQTENLSLSQADILDSYTTEDLLFSLVLVNNKRQALRKSMLRILLNEPINAFVPVSEELKKTTALITSLINRLKTKCLNSAFPYTHPNNDEYKQD